MSCLHVSLYLLDSVVSMSPTLATTSLVVTSVNVVSSSGSLAPKGVGPAGASPTLVYTMQGKSNLSCMHPSCKRFMIYLFPFV